MPPAEFAEKLEKEHPELFVKKTGKNKTEALAGRDKRAVIREQWLKAQSRAASDPQRSHFQSCLTSRPVIDIYKFAVLHDRPARRRRYNVCCSRF